MPSLALRVRLSQREGGNDETICTFEQSYPLVDFS